MTVNGPATPADRPRRRTTPSGDPLGMTEAEKLAAEWEARHDVASRGRRSAPDVVQHYVAHERLVESSGRTPPPPRPRQDEAAVGESSETARPTAEAPRAPSRWRHPFLWAGRRGR
ncbi:hypothetical protein [Blastococcus tunisiensis]|uniref:Uncharacterized protein n=1 Tax=Blastococcus tunisiensis TaxID=1798228 RepID=A0A1I2DZM9_9ACTN|nr:hypothetical protein [Blastococcus sp. DSM 46838]SFE85763.1 hypothetical protein SAMN05216574_106182 [Blastococcus sp. DSM 46838]